MALTLNLATQRSSGALVLNLGTIYGDRTAVIAGRNVVTGQARLAVFETATLTGTTAGSRGEARLAILETATLAGYTAACRGAMELAYDPNLLSDAVALRASRWLHGAALNHGMQNPIQNAARLNAGTASRFRTAASLAGNTASSWITQAELGIGLGSSAWTESGFVNGVAASGWSQATAAQQGAVTVWNEAGLMVGHSESRYHPQLPLSAPEVRLRFADGLALPQHLDSGMQDAALCDTGWVTKWNEAGLAFNAWLPPYIPPIPPIPPKILKLNLRGFRPAGPLILNLGYAGPTWDVADRRYYGVLNTCSVVRLPDRTELPVTAVSVETDCDSWAWSVSLALAGPDAWVLCQPGSNGFPREVEITINGLIWTALLDDPQLTRGFNSHRISAKGMSRSAWLTTPWTPSTTVEQLAPRTAQQIAEEILDGSGWALNWQLPADPQWLIPAGSYLRTGTPIERLVALVSAVKGCLYSDPAGYVFTAYPRYPVVPWNWDDAQVDAALPEAALLSWNQTRQDHPAVNRVYVSGTTAGVLLQLTRAGTAGDLCASDAIVDSLLTDSYSARARAEAELAGGGPGYEVSVETILGGTASIPLVRPGWLCEFAGIRGIVRSCSIGVSRNGGGLAVRQGLRLERRLN